jgi:hypothetical protein
MICIYPVAHPYSLVVDDESPAFRNGPTPSDPTPVFRVDEAVLIDKRDTFSDVITNEALRSSAQKSISGYPPEPITRPNGFASLDEIVREEDMFVLGSRYHPGELRLTAAELFALFQKMER